MTQDERQQVQNLINARTKLLSERIAKQQEQIDNLQDEISELNEELENKNDELESRDKEIKVLKHKLSESQDKNAKLNALLEELKPEPQPEIQEHYIYMEKPSYLASLLRQHFGYDSFRFGQEETINAILSGRDVFCSMPRNYGKSIIYRLSALLLPGMTLVITQTEPNKNILDSHSEYLDENISAIKKRELLRKLKNNSCKILYSSLQNLNDNDIKNALAGAEISLIAILTEWGNFDVEKLKDFGNFTASLTARKITTGIFADATSPTMRKTLTQIADLQTPFKLAAGFLPEKNNISFRIINTDEKIQTLSEILNAKKNSSGVIFCDNDKTENLIRSSFKESANLLILSENSYRELQDKKLDFMINCEIPESLGGYAQAIHSILCEECIILSSRKSLRLSERAVIQFCRDSNPEKILLSYLGQDENFSDILQVQKSDDEPKDETPTLTEDFDFGTSNEAQIEAITSTEGPLLIQAGAGTGKTYTLIQRAIFLIQKRRVKPENILLITSTEKNAADLIAKISNELSLRKIHADSDKITAGTFEAICEKILKDYSDKDFDAAKIDEFDDACLILKNLDEFYKISDIKSILKTSDKWENACELRDYIKTLTLELFDSEELIRDSDTKIQALGQAVKLYKKIVSSEKVITASGILLKTYKSLRSNPEILETLHEKFQYIMIDDYQNFGYIHSQILFLMSANKNICAAGDILCSSRSMAEFPIRFGKNECRVIKLILNYRSEPEIVKFFSEWIKSGHELKAYRTHSSNYPSVMRLAGVNDRDEWHEKILAFLKHLKSSGKISDYNEVAFLAKSLKTQNIKDLAKFLENNGINIYSGNKTFPERNEIYFALGCLMLIFPNYTKALRNINDKEPDYIKFYKSCLKYLSRFIEKPKYEPLKKWLIEQRNSQEEKNFSELIYRLFGFYPLNNALNSDSAAESFSRFINIIKLYENSQPDIKFEHFMNIYLREIIFNDNSEFCDISELPLNHVSFLTINQAKNLEFPIVLIDSLDSVKEKNLPDILTAITKNYSRRSEFTVSDLDFERLFYLGFSRAKDILVLTCNEDRLTPGKDFEIQYNALDDAENFDIKPDGDFVQTPSLQKFSFENDILKYEFCPTKYRFYNRFGFEKHESESENKDFINIDEYLDKSAINKIKTEINLERKNYIINAKIDLISIKDGRTEITDFKACNKPNININSDRKKIENYIRELNLYAYMIENELGLNIDGMKIRYINDEVNYKYDKSMAERVIRDFDATVNKILERDFEAKAQDNENCSDCKFRFYCDIK